MKIWIYARISTFDKQDLDTQLIPLREYAKSRWFEIYDEYTDTVSWTKDSRPWLNRLIEDSQKRKIDWILVYRFDRFSRNLKHLVNSLDLFNSIWVNFISYFENIDTSSSIWKLLFWIIWAFAEFEKDLISDRVKEWLNKARVKWKSIWRPKVYIDVEKVAELKEKWLSFRDIAKKMKLKPSSVHFAYQKYEKNIKKLDSKENIW